MMEDDIGCIVITLSWVILSGHFKPIADAIIIFSSVSFKSSMGT